MLRRALSPILILVIWEAAARAGFLSPYLLPAPSSIAHDLFRIVSDGLLYTAAKASLTRVIFGFAISVVISVLLGALMARNLLIEDFINPLVELIRPISPLALYPLALLWFGIGDGSKIFLIALSCSFPIILNTYAGVKSIDASLVRASESLGASNWEIFYRVILPGSLPHIFTGVRIAWGIALIVIIATEMIGATAGIGFMILDAQQTFKTDRVFSGIFVIATFGLLTDIGLRMLRRRFLAWHSEWR